MPAYCFNLAVAFDQLCNVLLFGCPDETLSARAHRARARGSPMWWYAAYAIDALFFWQEEHCYNAYLSEVNRTQQGPYYADKYMNTIESH